MDLKTFISQTLRDIAEAVDESQTVLSQIDVIPSVANTYQSIEHRISPVQPIDFDVMVAVDESAENVSGIGIFSVLSAGSKATELAQGHNATRIKFTIPIRYAEKRK